MTIKMVRKSQRQLDKLIEAAQTAIEFEVSGKHDFPFDMLRYDLCWPATESDANEIAANASPFTSLPRAQYSIKLKGLKPPTPGRWASFGWKVYIDGVLA